MSSESTNKLFRRFSPETFLYVVVWAFVLLVPIFEETYDYLTGYIDKFEWAILGNNLLGYLSFLLIFLLCKFVYEPKFFFRGRFFTFFLISFLTAFILILGSGYLFPRKLRGPRPRLRSSVEQRIDPQGANQPADSLRYGENPMGSSERRHPEDERLRPRPEDFDPSMGPPSRYDDGGPGARLHEPPRDLTLFIRGPFLPQLVTALLMIGSSLAIAVYFRTRQDRLKLKEQQAARLQSELDYLKYQINPHFFMNTLNNIHALVDIDSELAKEAIIELSRLMRYLLYESNQPTVPLRKEVSFLKHYLDLMKIRCDDSVTLTYEEPDASCKCFDAGIPPMLFISFIENAFKHGISHKEPSFINIKVKCEEGVLAFHCVNSNFSKDSMHAQQGGIGLDNVRKRLDLIYPGRYQLDIVPTDKEFTVDLKIPIS